MARKAGRRARLSLVLYGLLLVVGTTQAIGSVVFRLDDDAKKDHLRSVGVPVTADVIERDWANSAHRDKTTISYEVNGKTYTRTIKGLPGGETMRLLVDPEDPTSFLADNDSTDASRHPLNKWGGVWGGIILTAFGLAGFAVRRRDRARPRPPAKPALVGGPRRPGRRPRLNKKGKR